MKPQVKSQQSVKSNGITNSVKFGIKSSGLHHILGILRDQLYSDKILAVIREYSCNGVDAHTEAGCPDRSIEVTLPTKLKLDFKVRDFGSALNDQEIQDVYAFYGESTKRNSNDQIGMLGIGSKSAFAYGDNFVINSYIDGEKHIYNAFIDPSQVGQISKIGVESTKEENGIEVVVPVNMDDIEEFHQKAQQLFQWFKVRPSVKNAAFEYNDYETLFSGDGWRWVDNPNSSRYNGGEPMIVMGNIGYPVDRYNLELKRDDNDNIGELLTGNLVLDMAIGDVEISASRENLQYTDYTRKNISKQLRVVKEQLTDKIKEQFKDCKSLFAAKQLWGSVFDTTSNLYGLRNVLKDSLSWKGDIIDGNAIDCQSDVKARYSGGTLADGSDSLIELHKFKKSYRSSKYRAEEESYINCYLNTVIIENDLGHRRGIMGRVLNLLVNENKKVYLINFKDKSPAAKARNLLKKRGLDCEMLKLSELEKRPLAEFGYAPNRGGGTGGSGKSTKHSTKEFILNEEKIKNIGWSDAKSKPWDISEIDVENDTGVYVELDRFYIIGKGECGTYSGELTPRNVGNLLSQMKETLGIKIPDIYGFKIRSKSVIKVRESENWTTFWDWACGEIKKAISSKSLEQKYVNRVNALMVMGQYDWLTDTFYTDSVMKKDLVDGKAKTLLARIDHMMHKGIEGKLDKIKEYAEQLNVKFDDTIKPEHEIEELAQDVHERYTMLKHCNMRHWNFRFADARQDIINYINLVDVCNQSGV